MWTPSNTPDRVGCQKLFRCAETAPRKGLAEAFPGVPARAGSVALQGKASIPGQRGRCPPEAAGGVSEGPRTVETQRQDTPPCWISAGQNPYLRERQSGTRPTRVPEDSSEQGRDRRGVA